MNLTRPWLSALTAQSKDHQAMMLCDIILSSRHGKGAQPSQPAARALTPSAYGAWTCRAFGATFGLEQSAASCGAAKDRLACAQGDARVDSPKYRAFISYSHRDSEWADWLHKGIETYRPPRVLIGTSTVRGVVPKRLTPVFRDREELASATDLGTVISGALEQSACQIVICSPPAAKSRWVNEEILAFKRLGREDRIFCLIIAGEPNATDMPG